MYFGIKRNTKEIANTNFYIEMVNSQGAYWVKKEYLFLKQFVESNFSLPSKDYMILYQDSVSKLSQFLWWCSKWGFVNKSIRLVFSFKDLRDICDCVSCVAKFFGDSDSVHICDEFNNILCKYVGADCFVKDCAMYFVELLQFHNIETYFSMSNSSSSIYIKPDAVLREVRISDHFNPNYKKGISIICCSSSNATRNNSEGGLVYYVSSQNYTKVISDIVQRLVSARDEMFSRKTESEYDSLKYEFLNKQEGAPYSLLRGGIKGLSKLFER